MARMIFGASGDRDRDITRPGASAQRRSGPVQRAVQRTRTRRYREAIASLDPAAAQVAPNLDEVLSIISDEFESGSFPQGLVSQCYLGEPFEVHILDLTGSIVEHYRRFEPMPPAFERARRLATHPAYLAVEIYADRMIAIREDGSAVELEG